ncbi:MAG: hypothetical protein ACHQSE_12485 [Gemmatimonadales bacterium]
MLATVLLVALLTSCKDSTGLHAASSIVSVRGMRVTDTIGATVTVTVQVTGSDTRGVPVSFAVTAGSGSVSPAKTTTDETGVATANWTLGTTAGTGSDGLVATSGTLPAVKFSATALPGAPTALKVTTGNGQAGFFFLPVAVRPTVTAIDRLGNPALFSGTDVRFSVSAGGGSFSGGCCAGSEVVSNSGVAGRIVRPNDDWLLSDASPTQTLTATSPGLAPATIQATATAAPLPLNADWAQLAAQFAVIAVDAFEQTVSSPSIAARRGRVGGGAVRLREQPARAAAQLNVAPTFTASYMCCNLLAAASNAFVANAAAVTVMVQTSSSLDSGGSGSISVIESITEGAAPADSTCFGNCDLPFTATHALNLPSPGLTVSAVLSVVSGVIGTVQQLHLTGRLVYYSGTTGRMANVSDADVTVGFTGFPQRPASASGLFGVTLSNSPLPSVAVPNRADLLTYPKLLSTSDFGVQMQQDYLGPPGTDPNVFPGMFWTSLECKAPQLTAIGGAMSNIFVAASVAWPSVSPDYGYAGWVTVSPNYQSVPINYIGGPPTLAAGDTLVLPDYNFYEPYWGLFGPSASGTRTPWNAIYQVSYVVKSTGKHATYSLAYSCQ